MKIFQTSEAATLLTDGGTEVDIPKGMGVILVDPAKKGKVSGSGKSMVIESTQGNVSVFGDTMKLGLNLYTKLPGGPVQEIGGDSNAKMDAGESTT